MKSFTSFLVESPENHPFHSTAINSGFRHVNSSSMAGVPTHEYEHGDGHTLLLHTKHGNPGFRLKTKSGRVSDGDTAMRLKGAMLGAH